MKIEKFSDALQLAEVAHKSNFFKDVKNFEQSVVKILYGQELGLGAMQSLSSIHVIEGKPAMSSNLIAALLQKAGFSWVIKEHSREICTLEIYKGSKAMGIVSFDIDDAKQAELTSKRNWKRHPKDMLFARCISQAGRRFAPAHLIGVYDVEELSREDSKTHQEQVPASQLKPIHQKQIEAPKKPLKEEIVISAGEVTSHEDRWKKESRKFHALLKELEIDRAELKEAYSVDSTKDLTALQFNGINRDLQDYQVKLQDLKSSPTREDLRLRFDELKRQVAANLLPFLIQQKDLMKQNPLFS